MNAYLLSIICYRIVRDQHLNQIASIVDLCIADTEERAKAAISRKAQTECPVESGWTHSEPQIFPVEDSLIEEIYFSLEAPAQ